MNEMFECMLTELQMQQKYLGDEKVQTIYFGGGTPSLTHPEIIKKFLQTLNLNFSSGKDQEMTIEVNPDDLGLPYLNDLFQTGINRLSIGVQSFSDRELVLLNRRHNSKQASDAVEMARSAGFNNISIDLMYGIPGMKMHAWEKSLEKALSLEVQHISAYHLSIEKGTRFYRLREQGKLVETDEEESYRQFKFMNRRLTDAGFDHYEISSFAKPQKFSRHNMTYWTGGKYLGIGPSSHSFDRESRQWNVANNKKYMEAIRTGKPFFEKELLDQNMQFNEIIMTGLRTKLGIDTEQIGRCFGAEKAEKLHKLAKTYIESGQIVADGSVIKLTEEGFFISDRIMSELFC